MDCIVPNGERGIRRYRQYRSCCNGQRMGGIIIPDKEDKVMAIKERVECVIPDTRVVLSYKIIITSFHD